MKLRGAAFSAIAVSIGLALAAPRPALAHCDSINGPVLASAREALTKRDVSPVLKWVRSEYEPQVRSAFARTLKVRDAGPEAMQLADTYFFETLVRLHRAGEGAPYTGLKDGTEVDPAVAGADDALEKGSIDGLVRRVQSEVGAGLRKRFERARELGKSAGASVAAGREYVEAYVELMHYVERLHAAAGGQHSEHQ